MGVCLNPQVPATCTGMAGETDTGLIMPSTLKLPHFLSPDTLEVSRVTYRVLACIQHHGSTPTSGRFTVVATKDHSGIGCWMMKKGLCSLMTLRWSAN